MRIMLTGANGFIGSHIYNRLIDAGNSVTAVVRNPVEFAQRFPGAMTTCRDLNIATAMEDWKNELKDVDAVINCAGALRSGRGQRLRKIHYESPKAIFDACLDAGVRRVIQISAVSADDAAGTEFASTKKLADDYLKTLDLDWVILRPSLVYADGSYGGSSTLRGLAGLPGLIPLVGKPTSAFQPLHAEDLASGIEWLIEHPSAHGIVLDPAGPDKLTTSDMVLAYRRWLGFGKARIVYLPAILQKLLARIGDAFGVAAINSTALRQLEYGNTTDRDWRRTVPIHCRHLTEHLLHKPAQVQDRWHARLYFLKPFIRFALIVLWLGSAVAGSLLSAEQVAQWTRPLALGELGNTIVQWTAVTLDATAAAWLLSGYRPKLAYSCQFWAVTAYTLIFSISQPSLWLAPLGELLKNLPILALLAVGWGTAEER